MESNKGFFRGSCPLGGKANAEELAARMDDLAQAGGWVPHGYPWVRVPKAQGDLPHISSYWGNP